VVTFFNASWSFEAEGETFRLSELDGAFVHIGGASYSASVTGDDYRRIVDRHLRRLLDDGSQATVSN